MLTNPHFLWKTAVVDTSRSLKYLKLAFGPIRFSSTPFAYFLLVE
jgi:hypothetical protein